MGESQRERERESERERERERVRERHVPMFFGEGRVNTLDEPIKGCRVKRFRERIDTVTRLTGVERDRRFLTSHLKDKTNEGEKEMV